MSAAELWVAVAFGLCTFALVAACAAVWRTQKDHG